jgi:hypothetical protein
LGHVIGIGARSGLRGSVLQILKLGSLLLPTISSDTELSTYGLKEKASDCIRKYDEGSTKGILDEYINHLEAAIGTYREEKQSRKASKMH